MNNTPIDLKARARQAVLDAGFHPDFPAEVTREIEAAKRSYAPRSTLPRSSPAPRNLRSLLWSSIDNDTSKDLDQIEFAEKLPDGTVRLLVGIADVDSTVAKSSATDRHAASETTSLYTGVKTFPMLPEEFSTDLTSLSEAAERQTVVIEMHVLESGEVSCHDVYPALTTNRAKLAYSSTGAWLEGRGPAPAPVTNTPGLDAQLRLQQETSERLRGVRKQHGALTFGSIEATPVVQGGEIKDLALTHHTVAQDIIESFMVAANVAMAQVLKEKGSLSIRRVVKTPKRWDRIQAIAKQYGVNLPDTPDPRTLSAFLEQRKSADPLHFPDLSLSVVKLLGSGEYMVETPGTEQEGHFGLAAHDYTHSTAPNRRFADLATQRLLKATLNGGASPYTEAELRALATHCTEREDAARKVERLMRKVIAASMFSQRIGEVFDAIVTGATPKGTYVRLRKFPAEGKVVRNTAGLDVGDSPRVRLVSVDVSHGFIDFENLGAS